MEELLIYLQVPKARVTQSAKTDGPTRLIWQWILHLVKRFYWEVFINNVMYCCCVSYACTKRMFLKYGFFGRRLNKRAGKRPNAKSSNRRRRSVAIDKKKSYWVGFFCLHFIAKYLRYLAKLGREGDSPGPGEKRSRGKKDPL